MGNCYCHPRTESVTPTPFSDFRPISVTPLLSRIDDNLSVSLWLRPYTPLDSIVDQYAFEPTGSTTCALISLMDDVVHMRESNSDVRCLMVKFTKAFDTVNHVVLIRKLQTSNMPPNVYNWIISFLTGRDQMCKVYNTLSKAVRIVDCTRIWDWTILIIIKSDLHPKSTNNKLMKYADDTNLLVPENTNCT